MCCDVLLRANQHGAVLHLSSAALPCEAITGPHLTRNHEPPRWQSEASCLSSTHRWCVSSLAGLWRSLCLPIKMYHLIWLYIVMNNRELQTHGRGSPWQTRLLPSVFVKATGLFHKGPWMRVSCVVGGTETAFEWSLDHRKCTSADICCGGDALYAG